MSMPAPYVRAFVTTSLAKVDSSPLRRTRNEAVGMRSRRISGTFSPPRTGIESCIKGQVNIHSIGRAMSNTMLSPSRFFRVTLSSSISCIALKREEKNEM